MRSLLRLVALAGLCSNALAVKECKCKDGSMPLNYKEIAAWQNSNDPDSPQVDPPKATCLTSEPGPDCPVADAPVATGDTNIIKKGKCWGWERKDGKPVSPSDLDHLVDTRDCEPMCADEIANEKAKGHNTGVVCRLSQDNWVPKGDYKHIVGDCICNPTGAMDLAALFVNLFLESLPAMAKIIKEVWIQAFELVLTLPLNAIPGVGGALGAAVASTITAAKLCAWTYKGATGLKAFVNWGKGIGKLGDDIGDTFKAASGRTDQKFKPPDQLPKGSGKDGDKGAPPGWDKLDDGSDAVGKKGDKGGKPPKCDKNKKGCEDDTKTKPKTEAPKTTAASETDAASRTTVAATKSSSSASSIASEPCSPSSCAACKPKSDTPKRDIDQQSIEEDPQQQGLEKRRLRTPADFGGNAESFLMDQYRRAHKLNIDPPSAGDVSSTAHAYWLQNNTFNLAVGGLYGCTSVIVASRSGVWMSHFWEIYSFRNSRESWLRPKRVRKEPDKIRFQDEVIHQMEYGGPNRDLMPGLAQFTGPDMAFSPQQKVVWAIVTPDKDTHFTTQKKRTFRYDDEIKEIQDTLKRLFPGVAGIVIPYQPNSAPQAQQDTSTGKLVFAFDPMNRIEQNPNNPCEIKQEAEFRVWFENRPIHVWRKYWPATDQQLITNAAEYRDQPPVIPPPPPIRFRRDNQAPKCKLPDALPQAKESNKDPILTKDKAPKAKGEGDEDRWINITPI